MSIYHLCRVECSFESIGMGLIWYGQNYLIYPSAFPPGSRIGGWVKVVQCYSWLTHTLFRIDVATPRDFNMPYVPLDLKTEDDITLRCYLLLQKKDLGIEGQRIHIPNDMTEEEARLMKVLFLTLLIFCSCSLFRRDQQSWCFMEMEAMSVTEYHSLPYFTITWDATFSCWVIEGMPNLLSVSKTSSAQDCSVCQLWALGRIS